jgi:mannose-1-phosphate guanylyltransferase/phosphomannomutase
MQAVILAGGNATRLYSATSHIPKPLMPFFDRPVVEYAVRLLAKHDIRDIIIATSHATSEIVDYFGDGSRWQVSIRYSVESEPMGTAGAVKLAREMITGTFLVICGDIITDFDLRSAIRAHKSASGIATIVVHKVDDPTQFGMVERDASGRVSRFIEKPRTSEAYTDTVSAGIYVLEPESLSSIAYNQVQDFAINLFPRLLRNMEPVYAFEPEGYWCDVGDMLQYRNAHFDALQGRVHLDLPAIHAGEGIWVGDAVNVHPSVGLSSPVFIGSGASVGRNAVLGAQTVIGANARIGEGAYVARSVIGIGSSIGSQMRVTDTIISSGYAVVETDQVQPAAAKHSKGTASNKTGFARKTKA